MIDNAKPYIDVVHRAVFQIRRLVPVRELLILVDHELIREQLGAARSVVPFLEKDGADYGPPEDDETALREFDRMRARGAQYIAFFATEFCWLESYPGLASLLRSKFRIVWEDDSVIIFHLSGPALTLVENPCA